MSTEIIPFDAALLPGSVTIPAALLDALETDPAPRRFLGRDDAAVVLEQDFGFLRGSVFGFPGAPDTERLASLLRWLFAAVRDWSAAEDPEMKSLTAILVTGLMCGRRSDIWSAVPDAVQPSAPFLTALSRIVAAPPMEFSGRPGFAEPVWEWELVDAFATADTGGDWPVVARTWRQLEAALQPDDLHIAAVCCLARYDLPGLAKAADMLVQVVAVMGITRALPRKTLLQLALASVSARVRFCCALTAVMGGPPLDREEDTALVELLAQVSREPDEWRKWMAAFNAFPRRYLLLQRPLGAALARVTFEAATAYLDTLDLHASPVRHQDSGRAAVTDCLRSFGQHAPAEQRLAFWAEAYRRWSAWAFGGPTPSTHLIEVNRSTIDFAVVSHLSEGMGQDERDIAVADVLTRLKELQTKWHGSEGEMISAWNELLSRFQPYAHAAHVMDRGANMMSDNRIYYPFSGGVPLYVTIMFRIPEYDHPKT